MTFLKPKVICPICSNPATGPYDYKAMSKSGAYYVYQRYAHASLGSVSFCHVRTKTEEVKKQEEPKKNLRVSKASLSRRNPSRMIAIYHLLALEYLGGKCIKCKTTNDLQIDHIVPISPGGSDEKQNLQILCHSCHVEKHRYDNSLMKKIIAKALIENAELRDLESM